MKNLLKIISRISIAACALLAAGTVHAAQSTATMTELYVPKITCMACASKIKKNLKSMTGVNEIQIDDKTKKVRFRCTNCDLEAVKSKLKEIDYPVSETT